MSLTALERLPRRLDVLFARRSPDSALGLGRLLRDHDVVAGDDAWRRGRGVQLS